MVKQFLSLLALLWAMWLTACAPDAPPRPAPAAYTHPGWEDTGCCAWPTQVSFVHQPPV